MEYIEAIRYLEKLEDQDGELSSIVKLLYYYQLIYRAADRLCQDLAQNQSAIFYNRNFHELVYNISHLENEMKQNWKAPE